MLRSNCKSLENHVVSPGEEKERLQREGFAEKEGFKVLSGFQLPRGDWHDDRLMEIKPLDSGLFSGEWRLDDGQAILGECQMTNSRRTTQQTRQA